MTDANDPLAGLDFETPEIEATDMVKPCPEGDECIFVTQPLALVETVFQGYQVIGELTAKIILVIARHGSPQTANELFRRHNIILDEIIKPYILGLIEGLNGAGGNG